MCNRSALRMEEAPGSPGEFGLAGLPLVGSRCWELRPIMGQKLPVESAFSRRFTCNGRAGGILLPNPMSDKGLPGENSHALPADFMHTFSFFRNILRR